MEELVLEAERKAMRESLAQACREYEREKGCPACGGCAEQFRSKGPRRRVAIATFGRTVLHLRRLRCSECEKRWRPAEGPLEGANITRRLKRRGMRWLRQNADAALALRIHQLNDDWQDDSVSDNLVA